MASETSDPNQPPGPIPASISLPSHPLHPFPQSALITSTPSTSDLMLLDSPLFPTSPSYTIPVRSPATPQVLTFSSGPASPPSQAPPGSQLPLAPPPDTSSEATLKGPPFEVKYTKDKGFGCFATRDIQAGEHILLEKPYLWRHNWSTAGENLDALVERFEEDLSKVQQEEFLGLYGSGPAQRVAWLRKDLEEGNYEPEQVERYLKLALIFGSNRFEAIPRKRRRDGTWAPSISAVFLKASRLNHSCYANTYYTFDAFVGHFLAAANRPIKAGEELTITYVPFCYPRALRQRLLGQWGIECECFHCTGPSEDFDIRLEEAANIQGLVAASEERGALSIEDEEETVQKGARLTRRMQVLEALHMRPELFFAYHDFSLYLLSVSQAKEETDAERSLQLMERVMELRFQQVAIGEELWPNGNLLLTEARSLLELDLRRLGDLIERTHND
ncbi:uncharacterized protein F4822DRAFT_443501 [Hypoxylon trugodes]|uniref:uncharacterized protein n=1 Tax=Hypoxylon trugodes TaxID=326681 RepID=UPI002191CBF0|nr:uncharacterized protein F4822DRAFT_443501 [Hypoxylon trugodes]KAI1388624.1 hypothetical protein F4822DRAFT_443501 [Hypoxylon trugodes]